MRGVNILYLEDISAYMKVVAREDSILEGDEKDRKKGGSSFLRGVFLKGRRRKTPGGTK